ncbi:MAG: TIGR04222 domain-containing membrane protein [Streptomycetaceae bacterium]|nr:TIGR04222 domain-containing membrane protein [Streptomycetaceae bacterium]
MVWIIVSAVVFVAAGWYARGVSKAGKARRQPAPAQDALDLYGLAFLAGGPARAADVALLSAWGRGAITIAPDGRVAPGTPNAADPVAAAVDGTVRASGQSATVAGARAAVAETPPVRALRDHLFGMGLLNPRAHTANLRTARIVLSVAPLVAIAGLFIEPLAGSPSDDTAVWGTALGVVVLGTIACLMLLFFLFTRYDQLRSPLPDMALFHLWNQVRDPAGVQRVGDAVAGGKGLGEVALFGLGRIPDPTVREVFLQAARATAGRITSDGWTEQQWQQAADSRGQLGGPTYDDAYRATNANTPIPGQPGQPGQHYAPPTFYNSSTTPPPTDTP